MRIEQIDNASAELRQTVLGQLKAFNRAANPAWYAARAAADPQPLELFAFDDDGQTLGGLFGETQFLWLKVHILAVHEDCRGQGVGTQLMNEAEAIGVKRGCQLAYVDTMEYQAPRFYERLGYAIVGRLDNWDSHGHAKLFLTKALK